ALTWDYPPRGPHDEPVTEVVSQEINGRRTHDGTLVSGFADLAADGSTSCGCWIYSGVFPSDNRNRADERTPHGPYGHGWGYAWPSDRRILYNRASARPDGQPWSERKKLVWWDDAKREWTGIDTPDVSRHTPPPDAPAFIMHADGLGWLWAPSGLKDGPLPA